MQATRRRVLLAQLPIPQPGMEPARGNVPLAAGYLKLYAHRRGLDQHYYIEIFPAALTNTLGDLALVEALLAREPWLVGFTCYLWNVERTLWIAARLKERRPELRVILGGPEITADNAWVLESPAVDFAAIGEGEQTFAELLEALLQAEPAFGAIAGLHVRGRQGRASAAMPDAGSATLIPAFRRPLADLDTITSPYLEGILDASEEHMLLLETIRGCIFKCKFCYYPKSYDDLYFVSDEKIAASLRHAQEHDVREVILLDPTLNQRRDFAGFLRMLAHGNPGHRFTYFGELRAEGLNPEIATLLRKANFREVEIGLQSTDPLAQQLMDRKNSMRAFERGVRAMLDEGIEVKIDLIIGLPGDTVESVRRSMHYVRESGLYSDAQVFNLAVLPGTAFRQEAAQLGLEFQPRPPYYVLRTPTLQLGDFYELMAEAEELFDTEFDALPAPYFPAAPGTATVRNSAVLGREWHVDLDLEPQARGSKPSASERAQAFTIRLLARDFGRHAAESAALIRELLEENPHTTLQVVLEPRGDARSITPTLLERLRTACYESTTYLDRFYAILPGTMKGSKRIVVLLPAADRASLGMEWITALGEHATIVWRGLAPAPELQEHEYLLES